MFNNSRFTSFAADDDGFVVRVKRVQHENRRIVTVVVRARAAILAIGLAWAVFKVFNVFAVAVRSANGI